MPVVTSLDAVRGGRIAVGLDGERAIVVGQALVARWRLHVDRELSPEEVRGLQEEAARDAVLADAHRLLGHRSRSERELATRLSAKGHPPDIVAAVVTRLRRDGLVDDRAFAAAFVADKRHLSGRGRERIAAELAQAGVSPGVIDQALGPIDAAAETDRALTLLRRGPALRPPAQTARRRAVDRLRRRGFSAGVAIAAVDAWLAEQAQTGVPEASPAEETEP